MQHEPECPNDYVDNGYGLDVYTCHCELLRAAYQRGVNDGHAAGLSNGRSLGYDEGYRAGFNDHARSRAYAEAAYGPYRPRVLRENERIIDGEIYFQHGKGENP